ncbi:MAG: hypothetical protein AAF449_07270, partial [Myxococcota bacterium]
DFDVEWQLTECGGSRTAPDIDFEVRPSVARRSLPDVTRPFFIDYAKLGTSSAESNLTVNFYEGGIIKSINADVKDQSRAIVDNLLSAVVDISKVVSSRNIQSSSDSKPPCTPEVQDHLVAHKAAQEQVNDMKRKIDRMMAQTSPDASAVAALQRDMQAAVRRRDINAAELTVRQSFFWKPVDFGDEAEQVFELKLPVHKLGRFFASEFTTAKGADGGLVMDAMSQSIELRAVLRNLGGLKAASVGANPGHHFIYRNPGWAEFTVSRKAAVSPVLLQEQLELPQAGVFVALPLINKAFDSQTLSATFRPSGAPEVINYVSAARLVEISGAVKAAASVADDVVPAPEVTSVEAETALVEAQIKLLEAKKRLEEAQRE